MIISHKLKIMFIHVHRTGGTTFSNILTKASVKNSSTFTQHDNAKSLEVDFLNNYRDYYTFGFTRNSWDRILSWYSLIHRNDPKNLVEERKRFQEFIEQDYAIDSTIQHFHYNSLDYFSNKKGELIADKLFRYENLEDEIKSLLHQFDLPFVEIPLINETNPKKYQEYYTDRSRELIAQKCKKDIEYFNYIF